MLPSIDDFERHCIFLDFDGTLVEIANSPEDVYVDRSTIQLLEKLRERCGRAVAIVSGREIHAIDRLLHPLVLPVAGVHGLQRRDVCGHLHTPMIDHSIIDGIVAEVEAALGGERGVAIERKAGAVAIHYRLRPDFENKCKTIAKTVVSSRPELSLMLGKMVCEIKLAGFDKGTVIAAFLEEKPFKCRTPIFAGDDVTDEAGFAEVNARGGISIKVGEGPTIAQYRATNIEELHDWFHEKVLARRLLAAQ